MLFNFPIITGGYTTGYQVYNPGETQSNGLMEADALLNNPWPLAVPVLRMMQGYGGIANIFPAMPTPQAVKGLTNALTIGGFVSKSTG